MNFNKKFKFLMRNFCNLELIKKPVKPRRNLYVSSYDIQTDDSTL